MDDRDLFNRLEKALDRNTEAFERNLEASERHKEAFERNADAFDRNMEAFDRNTQAFERFEQRDDDFRGFMREMVTRMETAGQRQDAIADHMIGRLDALTKAVWKLIDRFDQGAQPAS